MGIADSAKNVSKRLKLDSHHAIERFGIILVTLTVIGAVLLGSTVWSAFMNTREQLSTTALYTSKFTTSRTQLPGEVQGVYVNPERNRTMVLMAFPDATKVSTDASNYKAFLSGSTTDLRHEPLKNKVAGRVVVFGATGYLAVVIDSDKLFAQQLLSLTVRANSELVYKPGDPKLREDLQGQASFENFDQWRIYFNPAASEATVLPSLGGEQLDPAAIYAETVTSVEEVDIRTRLDDQLMILRTNLNRIDEFESAIGRTSTVDGDFLVPPAAGGVVQDAMVPIAGDKVVGDPAGIGKDSNPTPSTLRLETDWVSPQGFDFDWRGGSIKEGYLAELVPPGKKYGEWLAAKASAENVNSQDPDAAKSKFRSSDIVWKLTDGSLVADHMAKHTPGMADVLALQANLVKAYDDYWLSKVQYQVKLPGELLELELAQISVEQSFSVNDAEGAFTIY